MYLLCLPVFFLVASSFTQRTSEVLGKSSAAAHSHPFGGAWVNFAGKNGGELTRQEITTQTEIRVDGCARGSRIIGFTLYITKNGQTRSFSNTSATLTYEMRAQLKSLSKGDQFEFKNTKAYLPNGKDLVDVHGSKFVVV